VTRRRHTLRDHDTEAGAVVRRNIGDTPTA
jgi:hypothetical protein